jgi:hypothetical protein
LCPAGQINDGEPTVAEAEMGLRVEAFTIRPTMALRISHRPQESNRWNCGAKGVEQTCYPAHGGNPFRHGAFNTVPLQLVQQIAFPT